MMTLYVRDADVLILRRPSNTASTPVTDRDDHTKGKRQTAATITWPEEYTCSISSETVERCTGEVIQQDT